jgi:hypothetical protein
MRVGDVEVGPGRGSLRQHWGDRLGGRSPTPPFRQPRTRGLDVVPPGRHKARPCAVSPLTRDQVALYSPRTADREKSDQVELQERVYRLIASRGWLTVLAALALCAALAAAGGLLLARVGPIYVGLGAVGAAAALWMLKDIEVAYFAVIGIVTLLPFGSFPFRIGFTPTLLDAALGALFLVWVLHIVTGKSRHLVSTALGLPVLAFLSLAIVAFVLGMGHASLSSYVIRHFGEIILSSLLFFLVVNTVRRWDRLERLARLLVICAFLSALIGVVLYLMPDDLALRVLSTLRVVGYPSGEGVIRYIRDDPTLSERAVSTSVDPNVLGSLLNMTIALTVPQLYAKTPLVRRRYLVPMLGMMGLCLGMTMSRGSMVGVAAPLVVMAVLKYRKLLWVILLALVLVLLLPQTQDLLGHMIEGFFIEDLATQMRMGEYKDALIMIGRYPLLGVGFAGSPDVDTYLGVACVYLLIAQQMGLLGLAAFLITMAVVFVRFWRTRSASAADERVDALYWGLHGALLGTLVGGITDHFYFNMDFHHSVTLFWLFVGMATVATELVRARARRQPTSGPGPGP